MMQHSDPQPEIVVDYACRLGEGPLWQPAEQCLYWLDIPNSLMYRYRPDTGEHDLVYDGDAIGGATVQTNGDLLLFLTRGRVAAWQEGQLDFIIADNPDEPSRFNDCIADPAGRVFCGTMPTADRGGRLYRLDTDGAMTVMLEGIGCTNGMGFTPDRKQMYYTDSTTRRIYLFDYDLDTGDLTGQRVFVQIGENEGVPDGMTVDAEGYVWSARWDGGCVVRYAPDGSEQMRIAVPAKKVTSVIFAGPHYDDMYLTTAFGDQKETEGDGAGALFRVAPSVGGVEEFFSAVGL